ncbi:MAG: HAMP domain-containing protein [Chloroflexota bacterium]
MDSIFKSNIGRRMLLLAAVSMFPVLTALAVSGWLAVQQSQARLAHESQALAQATGNHLDYILRQNLERLTNIQFAPGIDIEDGDPEPERRAVHSTYLGSIFDTVFITDLKGTVLWVEPSRQDFVGTDISAYPPVAQAIFSKKPIISDAFRQPAGERSVVYIISTLRNREGQVAGLVGGEIDPAKNSLRELILPVRLGATSYVDIIDGNGVVVASSDPQRTFTAATDSREVVSELARLPNAPWSVAVSQSKAEALAPIRALESRFVIAGLVSMVFVFVLSWGMARSLVKPIGQLKAAAQTITRGNLLQPVPPLGSDEIGELGRSFDTMRTELKKSLDEIQEWNRQLEAKIEERTRQLQDSYREIERKETARGQLLQKILMVQEEERKRVARELHDETTQSILGLAMKLEAAAAIPDNEVGRIKIMLNDVRKLAVNTLDSVHKVIFDLRPSVLDDLGLLSAIRWYVQNRLGELGIKARVEVTGEERELPPQVEIAMFRVAQEAITNIAKHAQAHNALVNVEFRDSSVALEIEDDGLGLDMNSLNPPAGESQRLGLLGMRERIQLLGGTFQIESKPDSGTHITAEVPLVR